MKTAITFVKNRQVSIVSSKEELLKEINHYKAFWLTNVGTYTNKENTTVIKLFGFDYSDIKWLSNRMKG